MTKANTRQVIDKDDRVPVEIKRLLEEYKEIVTKDIPNGLPPIRSISHCMDLIPGASFPKKNTI